MTKTKEKYINVFIDLICKGDLTAPKGPDGYL